MSIWLIELDHPGGTEYIQHGSYAQPGPIVWQDCLIEFDHEDTLSAGLVIDSVEILNTGRLDHWLLHDWLGQPVRIYYGEMDWPRDQFIQRASLINGGIQSASGQRLVFSIYDPLAALDVPVQAADDQPVTFGSPFNVTPVLSTNNLGYLCHSDTLNSVAVRDGGLTPASVTAGTPLGGFTLNQAVFSTVTCDPVGTAGTAAELVQALCNGTGLAVNTENLTGLTDWPLGIYASSGETKRDVLRQLLDGLGAAPVINVQNQLELRIWTPPAETPDHIIPFSKTLSVGITAVEPPLGEVTVRYARNWTPQDGSSLVAGVSDADRERYEKEWLTVTRTLSANPLAEKRTIDTPFTTVAGANGVLTGVEALRSVTRFRASVSLSEAYARQVRAGQTIQISWNRYGLEAGLNVLVLAVNPHSGQLEVFW